MDQLDLEAFPEHVQVALAEVVGAAREGVLALSVACGLQVVTELMAADLERICGPKGKHDAGREAYRHGSERRLLPLGGALVGADRPRARTTEGREVPLPTWEVFCSRDLLHEIALGRMLAGLSARRYRAGSEPGGQVELRGTSRSSISRRFRRATEAKLAELFGRDLSGLDLLAVFVDGMHVGSHLIVVALGVDEQGRKHPLGLLGGHHRERRRVPLARREPHRPGLAGGPAVAVRDRRGKGHPQGDPGDLGRARAAPAVP